MCYYYVVAYACIYAVTRKCLFICKVYISYYYMRDLLRDRRKEILLVLINEDMIVVEISLFNK